MLHDGDAERGYRLIDLAQWFGFIRQNAEIRVAIGEALQATGMATMPEIATLTSGWDPIVVRRSVKRVTDPSLKQQLGELLQLSVWTTGRDIEMVPRASVAESDPVILRDQLTWFHIDLRGDGSTIDRLVLFEFLAERCPGISLEVIDDLFSPDTLSGSRRHGIDRQLRVVSIPEIIKEVDENRIATVASASETAEHSKCGVLRRRMTEIAAGGRWVLTVWHSPTWHGKGIDRERSFVWDDPIGPDPQYPAVVDLVSRRWEVAEDAHSGYDLAMMILVVVANGHADSRRAMYTWLDDWDAEFYRADAKVRSGEEVNQFERTTLMDLRQLVTLFRTDAVALNSPQSGIENAWFPGRRADAEQFNAMLDRTIGDLRDLSDGIRTSFDLLSTAGMEQSLKVARDQAAVAKAQEEQAETLNRRIQIVGLLLLGPSLVATLLAVPKPEQATDLSRLVPAAIIFVVTVLVTLIIVFVGRTTVVRGVTSRFAARRSGSREEDG